MEWLASLGGGIIGFAFSLGSLATGKLWESLGKPKIYYMFRNGDSPLNTFGSVESRTGPTFVAPLSF